MNAPEDFTQGLDSVSLDELNAQAELMTRVDRKYLVPFEVAGQIVNSQRDQLRVLEIDGSRSFSYSSRYYDTESLDSYRAAATGRRHRFKVRLRTYEDSGLSFLEVKTRTGRGENSKNRCEIDPRLAGELLSSNARRFVDEQLSAARFPYRPAALTETLVTTYERSTFLHTDGSRITIDSKLEWHRPESHNKVQTRGLVIVETKSASSSPDVIDQALWRLGHRPDRISKYATGLALLRPELASNRWNRTLRFLSSNITLSTPTHRAA